MRNMYWLYYNQCLNLGDLLLFGIIVPNIEYERGCPVQNRDDTRYYTLVAIKTKAGCEQQVNHDDGFPLHRWWH